MGIRPIRQSRNDASDEVALPLLGSNGGERSNLKENGSAVLAEDIDSFSEHSVPSTSQLDDDFRDTRTVRFDEREHIIAPPLRSMTQSRETGAYQLIILSTLFDILF